MHRLESLNPLARVCALQVIFLAALGLQTAPLAGDELTFEDGFEDLPCVGLGCFQVECPSGQNTSISGVAYAPNGTLPLPNVTVYVPNGALQPLSEGAQCDRCGTPPSGNPLVLTTSGPDGAFVLSDMPVTTNVPLVLQSGKWRRQVTLPSVAACVDTPLASSATRLPRNQSEGHLPRIAVTTGAADALECVLRQAGIDDAEFTVAAGGGRVNLFAGTGGSNKFDGTLGGEAFGSAETLWGDADNLALYDLVALSCEGGQFNNTKTAPALAALKAYADLGGRVYLSHWHNYWIQAGPAPWNSLATWSFLSNLGNITADVNLGFTRGAEFSAWLTAAGATATPATLTLTDTRHTVTAINETLARKWVYKNTTANLQPSVQYFSFTTPVEAEPAQQCGRAIFADLHANTGDSSAPTLQFPSGGCTSPLNALTPTAKAVLYALFDLGRCVGNDRD